MSDLSLGLNDHEEIDRDEVYKHGVVINIPTIYVACENQEPEVTDKLTENLRVIKFETLCEYIPIGLQSLTMTPDQLQETIKKMTKALSRSLESSENIAKLFNLMDHMTSIMPDIDVDDSYFDTLTESNLSFDMIMEYENDPITTLLVNVKPAPYENYHFYSQIEDAELVTRVRRERKDTDMNRFHRCMRTFEQILAFVPTHVPNSILKIIAIGCLYLYLVIESKPIKSLSRNDLRANQLGFMIDCFARSRVLQAWQKTRTRKMMLFDIAKNYDKNHVMVTLCKIENAKERAKYVLSRLNGQEKIAKVLSSLYDQYEKAIKLATQRISGADYYVFDNSFIEIVATLENIGEFGDLVNDAMSNGSSDEQHLLQTGNSYCYDDNDDRMHL